MTEYRVVSVYEVEGHKQTQGFQDLQEATAALNSVPIGLGKLQARDVVERERTEGPWLDISL